MAYKKQTFTDFETKLKAEHLDHIEEGILANEQALEDLDNNKQDKITDSLVIGSGMEGSLRVGVTSIGSGQVDTPTTLRLSGTAVNITAGRGAVNIIAEDPNGASYVELNKCRITNLGEPDANTDATTKNYVDTRALREREIAKQYTDDLVGDIDTALDNIIAIQNSLIGGESV